MTCHEFDLSFSSGLRAFQTSSMCIQHAVILSPNFNFKAHFMPLSDALGVWMGWFTACGFDEQPQSHTEHHGQSLFFSRERIEKVLTSQLPNYALRWKWSGERFLRSLAVLWAACCLPKPSAPFQSLTSIGSWKDRSEQRRPVLPAPLAGLLSWPFSAKEGGGELGQSWGTLKRNASFMLKFEL